MSCSNIKMPCFRFIASFIVTLGGLIFGCLMLGLGKSNSNDLTAFYTSLISSCIMYWATPPKYNSDDNGTFSDI